MPNPNKVFDKRLNQHGFNLLIYLNLFVSFLGSLFLAWNDILAGKIYAFMFVGVMALIGLAILLFKNDNTLGGMTDYVRLPFGTKLGVAIFFYLVGQLVPVLVKVGLSLAGASFSVTSFSIPLFGADIGHIQSFSAAQISASTPWKIFIIMFTAGNQETFAFNFGTVLFGAIVGYFTLQLLNDGKDFSWMKKKIFVVLFAFLTSLVLFVLAHELNTTYVGVMFVVAGVFLLLSNVSIYVFGTFLTFWMGYHQSNNLLYLIEQLGGGVIAQGFLSWFGLIFLVYELLLVYYLLRHTDEVKREVKSWFNSRG